MKKPLKKVFVVFKTHFDIGFTHLAKEVVSWYGKGMIEDVLKVCRATKEEPKGHQYVWTVPSWPMKKVLDMIENPNIRKETEEYLHTGQLVWHGLPFTTHTEVCGIEDFVRGLLISMRLGEKYGRRVRDAKMTDVPGHPWILPTILHQAGIRFLHLGSNFCATPPNVPRLFWWEGPDGSRILTYYSKGGYGSDLLPPDDWEYPYWLAMLQTLDNLGAQDTDYLKNMFRRAEKELPGVEVSIGTLEEFGEAMIQSGVEIPVVKGDLSDTWIRGVGSAPQGVAQLRKLQSLAGGYQAAQILNVSEETQPRTKYFLEEAYEKMLLFSEHTWSMDTKVTILPERYYGAPWIGFRFWESGIYDKELFDWLRLNDPGYLKLQESWQEQLDYLIDANNSVKQIEKEVPRINQKGITVFGTLGIQVPYQLNLSNYIDDVEGTYVLVGEEGNIIAVYQDIDGIPRADIILPIFGERRYQIVSQDNKVQTANHTEQKTREFILENTWIKATINLSKGEIVSFVYKPEGKEWVDRDSKIGFGQYLYEIYGSEEIDQYLKDYLYVLRDWGVNDIGKAGYLKNQGHQCYVSTGFSSVIKKGQGWSGITLTVSNNNDSTTYYGNAKVLEINIVLWDDKNCLDIVYRLLDKQPTPFIESGHFAFPLKTENPKYLINKLGCVIDPQTDVVADCNTDLYCLENWTAVEDQGCGLAVAVKEAPLMSYEQSGILRFKRNAGIEKSTLLMQGFNNAWGTNFPQWSQGNMEFSYRFLPYTGKWQENQIWQMSKAFRYEPLILAGQTQRSMEWFEHNLPNLLIETIKRSENEKGFILRVRDISGECETKKILFHIKIKNAALATLLEEPQQSLVIKKEKQIQFSTKPYGIYSIYFELK